MPKRTQAKKKPFVRRGVKHPHFQQMMVDEKTKMNEMLKTMLARGPGPFGTTVLGGGHNEAERKLTDKINDVHNLQLQYNRGKEEIESWIRKEKEMKQLILDQQKKDAKNQIKDQMERQNIESQKSDVNMFRARAAGATLNVQFQGQINKEQQSLKDKELDIQLAWQKIGHNTVYGDLQRAKTKNKAKDIELQALKQTLASDEFNNTDKALMEQYRKAEFQKMELEHMRNILKINTENNIERAKIEAMNQANEAIQSNLPKLQTQNVEIQLVKKARQAELTHAEDPHNQYLQLQHEHEQLEQDNKQLQFQIDVTKSKAKALTESGADVINKTKDQLEQNARLQLVKELADQTLAKEKNISQMNLATELEKKRQIREHKFDASIQKLAKEQVEADQLKQKAEAQSHANQALQEYNKLKAMRQIRDEHVADGKDDTYAAIPDKMNQKTSAGSAKDEALYEAKNKYNDVANVHYGL